MDINNPSSLDHVTNEQFFQYWKLDSYLLQIARCAVMPYFMYDHSKQNRWCFLSDTI